MPLACASGLYLQGERGSRREKDCETRSDNSPFFQLGTVEAGTLRVRFAVACKSQADGTWNVPATSTGQG